jgi:hypothetical protein
MWEYQPLATLRPSMACTGITLPFVRVVETIIFKSNGFSTVEKTGSVYNIAKNEDNYIVHSFIICTIPSCTSSLFLFHQLAPQVTAPSSS